MTSQLTIRAVQRDDYEQWHALWTKYLEFYESSVAPEIYQSTFDRFFSDGEYEPNCFVAEKDGALVGLVHFMAHRHNWRIENVCYLQDLYSAEHMRGEGIGRKLIEAVYAHADEAGLGAVYWLTQDFNAKARKLYDRIATLTPFIKYQR